MAESRDATVPFLQYLHFLKLQILVILSKMPQNTFFLLQGSLCVHFYGNKMKNTVFVAKMLGFFILKKFFSSSNTFMFRKRLASL